MIKNIADYLEAAEKQYGNKTAYSDESRSITFGQLKKDAQKIASAILKDADIGAPVLVYMDKCVECIEAFR